MTAEELRQRRLALNVPRGRFALLLGVTPEHVQTLAHITDPIEAASLVASAESSRRGGTSTQFMDLFTRADRDFVEPQPRQPVLADEEPSAAIESPKQRVGGVADRIRNQAA